MLTRIKMMQRIRPEASGSSPDLPIMREMVLVTPMAPSPMTINVNSPMRSTRCVFLKLNMRQKHETATVAMLSIPMTTHQML